LRTAMYAGRSVWVGTTWHLGSRSQDAIAAKNTCS
jgi:hypothetical protein